MQKILVTGADGFIGSHLTELLLEKEYKVRALSQYNSFNYWGWLEDIPANTNLEVVTGDVRDPFLCEEITKGIDIVFHLAALIAIPYSYVAPQSYVETNVVGTLNMCSAARKNQVRRFLLASTSEVYGTAQYVPIDEKHPKQPQSPYSATKIGADAIALSYFNAFQLPVIVVRPFNTYGPRQSARAVIPTIVMQLLNGKKEIELGDTKPTRDLLFVEDTARGFLEIAKTDILVGQEVNIATESEISIGDLAQEIINQITPGAKIVTDDQRIRPISSEVFRLFGANGKIKRLTTWKQEITLEQGLKRTIDWFRKPENLKKYKTGLYNV